MSNPVERGEALIIARRPIVVNPKEHIVLCFLGLDNPTPYVTWREYTHRDTGKVMYEGGHYFHHDEGPQGIALAGAVQDYATRKW